MIQHATPNRVRSASPKAHLFSQHHVVHKAWQCSDKILDVLDEFSEHLGKYTEQTGDIATAQRLGKWTHLIRSSIDNQEVEQSLITLSTCGEDDQETVVWKDFY